MGFSSIANAAEMRNKSTIMKNNRKSIDGFQMDN
jgi:hypothetical protein